MKTVFADTSYYVALFHEEDVRHDAALSWSLRFRGRVVVTDFILIELGSTFSKLRDRQVFLNLITFLRSDPRTVLVPLSHELFEEARCLFEGRMDKEWSLVDCTSFVVMKQKSLTDALTTDRHFTQAGYKALLA